MSPAGQMPPEVGPARSPSLLSRLPIGVIRVYQWTLSPLIGRHCRFHPTCSHYAVEAYVLHGVWRGTWLTVRRLARCHPLGGKGYDPVPWPDTVRSHGPAREPAHPALPPPNRSDRPPGAGGSISSEA